MKKLLVLLLVTALVMGIVAIAGCGEKKVTVETDEGDIEVTEKDGKVTTSDGEGETYTAEKIDVKDIGIPIYPGAKLQEDSAAAITSEGADGEETGSVAVMETKDPVSEVIAWYKNELSGKTGFTDASMAMEGEEVGMLYFQDGDEVKSVIIGANEETGATEIVLSSGSGEGMTIPGATE